MSTELCVVCMSYGILKTFMLMKSRRPQLKRKIPSILLWLKAIMCYRAALLLVRWGNPDTECSELIQSCTYLCLMLKRGTQWTHNSTYQVPDIAWLKMGGRDGRKDTEEMKEMHKRKRKRKKERVDKENKPVRSMSREQRSKTIE